ncbi:putative secreted protein (Por secretion system target) [Winogradskyella pacifica]|uniref:Aminopeptidase N n=1 Tax=Winogradskyella pacifica TaxID=664642 RepID=A0A3D9LM60_9FLAO|nr:M1 family aminopeptidase [Winogradskyella pacifica]REE08345.1 putative secreted protein (Por secretion system target) [Winogradskyella pacifica]
MKRFLGCLILVLAMQINAQDYNETLNAIRSAEANTALRQMMNAQNANTGNYDVKYHRLELNIDPAVAAISGDVTTYFEAKEALTEITFDLSDNMMVSQVLQRGNSLSYIQNSDDELVITLPATQAQGVLDSLTISYAGNPVSSGFGSFEQTTHGADNDPVIWTLSEPYGAKGWWPCKQDLIDKIENIDVYITTPVLNPLNKTYVAVSNGLEQSQVVVGSEKTTHFKHGHPIPAYLIAVAVTNYEVYSHVVPNNGNPFDIINYVYPEDINYAQANTGITVDIMNLFTDLFEEYPFADEKYGHAQFGWGGGMEHTTVSFMGSFNRGLIAHELAHQWFGNKITCGSWKDIWLNEGFATYLSGLVIEDLDGEANFKSWRQQTTASITSQPGGAVYLTDQDTTSVNRIFSSRLTYNKGAMVLHMLRRQLGDVDFYQGLKAYLATPTLVYDYAKTQDFIAVMESSTGQNLDEFFNDWLYNQGYPSYSVNWNQDDNQLQLMVSQTQSDASVSFFEAGLPIRVIGTLGESLDLVLDNTTNNEQFFETVNFTVLEVLVDPDYHLISKNNASTLSTSDFELQDQITIYPSPASSVIHIVKPEHMEIETIKIYNSLGQLVLQQNWTPQVDLNTLASGLLFVQIQTKDGVINKRIIKN